MWIASFHGKVDAVKILLKYGANPERQNHVSLYHIILACDHAWTEL